MMTEVESISDAELVSLTLRGDRDAFEAIVARYQTLICSLTFSATGNLARSEDLAQEVFIAAWKSLGALQEPAKLKSWLCSIARRKIANNFRRSDPPADFTDDELAAIPASTPDASDEAITREEEALLWRAIGSVPEQYREPLVLFYRQGQSVAEVAAALDISEDAVKQRLLRGRNLLRAQLARFVESTLVRSIPKRAFAGAVIAALPFSASAATVGALGAGKGAAVGQAAPWGALTGALLGPIVGILGAWLGVRVSLAAARTEEERRMIKSQVGWISALIVVFTAALLIGIYAVVRGAYRSPALSITILVGLPLLYVIALGAMVLRFKAKHRALEAANPRAYQNSGQYYERRSSVTFLGLPLYHFKGGRRRGEPFRPAIGWIAAGDCAIGVIAFGGISFGVLSLGGFSIGAVAFGGMALGGISVAGLALGVYAVGGMAAGYLAFGGAAVAWKLAYGGFAVAHDMALGGLAFAQTVNTQAVRDAVQGSSFFDWAEWGMKRAGWFQFLIWCPMALVFFQFHRIKRRLASEGSAGRP